MEKEKRKAINKLRRNFFFEAMTRESLKQYRMQLADNVRRAIELKKKDTNN